jgi:nucleotide-binding universal stress UspA family protein
MRYSTIIVGTDGACDATATLVKADPGQALLTTASEQAAALIVVGNSGIKNLPG